LRLSRKVEAENIGEFTCFEALRNGGQIGVKFNVVGGKFPDLTSTYTHHAVVRMEPFPSSGIEGQLEVFKQAPHVP
jgi:hypothetical protein